jgi:hypothetical protein
MREGVGARDVSNGVPSTCAQCVAARPKDRQLRFSWFSCGRSLCINLPRLQPIRGMCRPSRAHGFRYPGGLPVSSLPR